MMVGITAASAGAAAHFEECNKKGQECKPGIGKGKVAKGKSGAAALHTPALHSQIKCKSSKSVSSMASPTTENKVVAKYAGCTAEGKPCASGSKKGTIQTKVLSGPLGDLGGGKVGVELHGETSEVVAEFNCEGIAVVVKGEVIGELAPVGVFTNKGEDIYALGGGEKQLWTEFAGGPAGRVLEATLGGAGPFESSQEQVSKLKGEKIKLVA
jgi:hypothetical protein